MKIKSLFLTGVFAVLSPIMVSTAHADLFKGFGGICNSTIYSGRLVSGYFYQNYHAYDGWVAARIDFNDTEGNSGFYFGHNRKVFEGFTVPRRMLNTGFAFYDMDWEASNGMTGVAVGAPSNCVKNRYNTGDVFTGEHYVPVLGN